MSSNVRGVVSPQKQGWQTTAANLAEDTTVTYYWHVVKTPKEWETLTKQTDTYPESFPVLAGCVALSDTEFVVCPLPVAEIPNLLASGPIGIQYHGHVSHQDTQDTPQLPDGEETNREG